MHLQEPNFHPGPMRQAQREVLSQRRTKYVPVPHLLDLTDPCLAAINFGQRICAEVKAPVHCANDAGPPDLKALPTCAVSHYLYLIIIAKIDICFRRTSPFPHSINSAVLEIRLAGPDAFARILHLSEINVTRSKRTAPLKTHEVCFSLQIIIVC